MTLCFVNCMNAQIISEKEVKGTQNVYMQKETKGSYIVFNKNNKLAEIDPSYLLYNNIPPVTVGNKSELDKIVHAYIVPYFNKYQGEFSLVAALTVSLFSDIDGNLREVRISYPKEIGMISGSVFEEFEAAVLQSNVKLVFDKEHYVFQGTAWVGQYAIYDPEKLRNCKGEH